MTKQWRCSCGGVINLVDGEPGFKRFCCEKCGVKNDPIPVINGVCVKHNDLLSVVITCPFCGRQHYHGPQPLPDLRVSHCPGIDGKSEKQRKEFLEQHPRGYKGGTYYINEVDPGRYEVDLAEYTARYMAHRMGLSQADRLARLKVRYEKDMDNS